MCVFFSGIGGSTAWCITPWGYTIFSAGDGVGLYRVFFFDMSKSFLKYLSRVKGLWPQNCCAMTRHYGLVICAIWANFILYASSTNISKIGQIFKYWISSKNWKFQSWPNHFGEESKRTYIDPPEQLLLKHLVSFLLCCLNYIVWAVFIWFIVKCKINVC